MHKRSYPSEIIKETPDWDRLEKALLETAAKAGGQIQPVPVEMIEHHWHVRLICQVPLCED